jgi:hypothetical protein
MFKNIYILISLFIITSCENSSPEINKSLSALIQPEFTYSQDFFDCTINSEYSLINLESFFSSFIDSYKIESNIDVKVSVLFPDKVDAIKKFIISVISDNNPQGVSSFVEELSAKGFSNIASCSFSIYQMKGFNIVAKKIKPSSDYVFTEILRCKYNKGYNFGTFMISIERFLNQINSLDIPYALSYIKNTDSDNDFLWINSFYDINFKDQLSNSWIKSKDSIEIQDEFNSNSSCIDSKSYKSYQLI